MKKIEYKEKFRYQVMSIEELNSYGRDGWELCCVIGEYNHIYIFKKRNNRKRANNLITIL